MKKAISIIALALALTMMMSVAAFADDGFVVDPAVGTSGKVTATAAGDDINVVIANATTGAYYGVLLTGEVAEGSYPTDETVIYYINQDEAPAGFTVKPITPDVTTPMTLFVSTNADEALVRIPVSYVIEPEVTGPVVTFMNGAETVAANLVTDADGNVTLPADVAWNGAAPATGNTFKLYSWVTADGATEYVVGNKVAAAAIDGKTLYAKFAVVLTSGKDRKIGDVNGDGNVRASDYQDLKMGIQRNNDYAYVKDALYTGGRKIGDVNGDGNVRASDYQDLKMGIQRNDDYAYVKDTLYIINK